nr:hypothetical protein [Streptomyces olivochromogenes]
MDDGLRVGGQGLGDGRAEVVGVGFHGVDGDRALAERILADVPADVPGRLSHGLVLDDGGTARGMHPGQVEDDR